MKLLLLPPFSPALDWVMNALGRWAFELNPQSQAQMVAEPSCFPETEGAFLTVVVPPCSPETEDHFLAPALFTAPRLRGERSWKLELGRDSPGHAQMVAEPHYFPETEDAFLTVVVPPCSPETEDHFLAPALFTTLQPDEQRAWEVELGLESP